MCQVSIRSASSSNQVAYLDIQFQEPLKVTQILFANSLASEVQLQLNGRIGRINGHQVQHAFACSDIISNAVTQLGTNECYLINNKRAVVGRMQHSRGVTLTPGSPVTLIADSVESDDGL